MHPLESPIPALPPLEGGPRQLSNEPNDVAPNSRHHVTQTVQSQRRFQKQSHQTLPEPIYKATSTKRTPAKSNGHHYCLLHGVRLTVSSSLLLPLVTETMLGRHPRASPSSWRHQTIPPAATSTSTTGLRSARHVPCFQIDLAVRLGRTKLSQEF